mgnify:CR=1 FL=1
MFFTKRKYIIRPKSYIISSQRHIIYLLSDKNGSLPDVWINLSMKNPLWNLALLKELISVYKETGDDFFKNRLRLRIIHNYYYILNF